MFKDPFYDYSADEEDCEEYYEEDYEEEESDNFRENTPEEDAHVADIYERKIYGDDLP